MPENVYYISDSEQEEETPDSESEEEAAGKPSNGRKTRPETVSEYEKQRLSRIAENRARMEALGLPAMASSLMGSAPKAKKINEKGKGKAFDEDQDYEPSSSSAGEEDVDADDDDDDDDEDYLGEEKSSGSRRKKSKVSKPKRAPSVSKLSNDDYIDEDEALKQAIALSLQGKGGVPQCSDVVDSNVKEIKGTTRIEEDRGRKRKKSFASRLQMTEDEFILHFFQFDETCSGGISVRDLERVATCHDFMWTDKELADMIRCFDSDGDGKLSLDEFRKIVLRCNMIKEPEQS